MDVHKKSKKCKKQVESNCTQRLVVISCTFYLFINIIVCTSYPICHLFDCNLQHDGRMSSLRANSFYVSGFDAEIISKCTLYLLFIGRLYNPNYQKIYKYSHTLLYVLWFIVFLIWVLATTVSALFGVYFFSSTNQLHLNLGSLQDINIIYICSTATFILMDVIWSIITLYLFIKPLFSYYPQTIKMRKQIKKYCILSCIAICSSTIYALTAMGIYYILLRNIRLLCRDSQQILYKHCNTEVMDLFI